MKSPNTERMNLMEKLSPYEEKILSYFRRKRNISAFVRKYGKESLDILTKLYESDLIEGSFRSGKSYHSGNLTDNAPSGIWSVTPEGRLYFRQRGAEKSKRVKDLLFENLIAFGFGLVSGLVVGIAVGYILPK